MKRTYNVYEFENYELEMYKSNEKIEFWLYKKGYGVKMFCIGIGYTKHYKDIINRNIYDWVDTYKELYESEEI